MADSINKPKVFLSHSSIDKPFVSRLYEDLRKCKIDAWLDTEEIRDGRSWLKVIFQDGIPACDAVMVYLTENSIKSKMVEKELDAAILHQLDDGGVVVLPYVSDANVRNQLRHDLRTHHCRVWNEQNYQEILPSVVAEIWHSYLERVVETAVSKEKVRRLELELENQQLKKVQERTVFTSQEDVDFQYIYQDLGKRIELHAQFWKEINDSTGEPAAKRLMWGGFEASLLEILLHHLAAENEAIADYSLIETISKLLEQSGYSHNMPDDPEDGGTVIAEIQSLILTLRTFGLLTPVPVGRRYGYTEKLFRFRYWLTYNNLYPTSVNIELIGRDEN